MYLACTHICVFSICIFIFLAAISNLQILIFYVRNEGCHILQIDTNDGTVEILDNVELPETYRGSGGLWQESSGAFLETGIYYMPFDARRIMRLNPDNDSLSSVGDDLGEGGSKYCGTVVGRNDDCVYGIPNYTTTRIARFDQTNPDKTSTLGEEAEEGFYCENGVLGGDGDIYAANNSDQVLKIDVRMNCDYTTWIVDEFDNEECGFGWCDPVVGVDNCIYWPPLIHSILPKVGTGTCTVHVLLD